MDSQGIFIALEGTDGSGKGTQFKRLVERLTAEGYPVAAFDFPRYGYPSSYFVKQYLSGQYGSPDAVSPYTGSLFYALDRYDASQHIQEALNQGRVVIANRFAGSNMAHQGAKFHNSEERKGYYIWVDNLEFHMLQLPRPTKSFVLRVPAEVSQELIAKKETRSYNNGLRDIHETDSEHIEKSVEVYDELCGLFPKDFQPIDCVRDGKLMSIELIHEQLYKTIQPYLPSVTETRQTTPSRKASHKAKPSDQIDFSVPASLNEKTAKSYRSSIEKIIEGYLALAEHAPANIARLVLPVAASTEAQAINSTTKQGAIEQLAVSELPQVHNNETGHVTLHSHVPKNELDLTADILYPHSNLSLEQLQKAIASWPIMKKYEVFDAIASDARPLDTPAATKAIYSYDIMCDIDTITMLQDQVQSLSCQPFTPRYGYDVPAEVEKAGLTSIFEACFDESLALYSQLQSAGHSDVAHYTILLGHKQRAQVACSASELYMLYANSKDAPHHALVHTMVEKQQEVHPALGKAAASQLK